MKTREQNSNRKNWRVEFYGAGQSVEVILRNRSYDYVKALALGACEAYIMPEDVYFTIEELN